MVIELDDLHTVSSFADLVGFSKFTIYAWIREGLPCLDIHGTKLIHRQHGETWMARRIGQQDIKRNMEAAVE